MSQELLLEKLEGLASKAKLIEGEKAEAVARIQELETEADKLKELISLAESKADEMLMGGSTSDASEESMAPKAEVTSVPLASKELEEPAKPSASHLEELKRRFPHAFEKDLL